MSLTTVVTPAAVLSSVVLDSGAAVLNTTTFRSSVSIEKGGRVNLVTPGLSSLSRVQWGTILGNIKNQIDLLNQLGVPPRNTFWLVDPNSEIVYRGSDFDTAAALVDGIGFILYAGAGVFPAYDFSAYPELSIFGQGSARTIFEGNLPLAAGESFCLKVPAAYHYGFRVSNTHNDPTPNDIDYGIMSEEAGICIIVDVYADGGFCNGLVKRGIHNSGAQYMLAMNVVCANADANFDAAGTSIAAMIAGGDMTGDGPIICNGIVALTSGEPSATQINGFITTADRVLVYDNGVLIDPVPTVRNGGETFTVKTTTTGAETKALIVGDVPDNSVSNVECLITSYDTAADAVKSWRLFFTVKNVAGVLTLVDLPAETMHESGSPQQEYSITLDNPSKQFSINAVSVAGQTVTWAVDGTSSKTGD